MVRVRSAGQQLLTALGYRLFNVRRFFAQDGLYTLHNDHFRSDPQFRAAYARGVKASHGVDPQFEWRVHIALWAAQTALHAGPGDFIECGVNAGFISSAIMERLAWNTTGRRFFLCDTFEGPVPAQYTREEIERGRLKIVQEAKAAGAYVTDLSRIRDNYAEWNNVEIVKGPVPDTLTSLPVEQLAFLHLDMNCAYPERAALEFFWKRIVPGGVVLLDDYAFLGHEEQAQAMDEAAHDLGATILSVPTGQGVIVK